MKRDQKQSVCCTHLLVGLALVFWWSSQTEAVVVKQVSDNRVRFMQFYYLDEKCVLTRFLIGRKMSRFNSHVVDVDFFDTSGRRATNCTRQNHNFLVQYNGQYIITLSRLSNNIIRTSRHGIDYDGKRTKFNAVDDVNLAEPSEADGIIILGSCFMDLETFIICALQRTDLANNGEDASTRIQLKRLLIDDFNQADEWDTSVSITSDSKAIVLVSKHTNEIRRLLHDPSSGDLYIAHEFQLGKTKDRLLVKNFYGLNASGQNIRLPKELGLATQLRAAISYDGYKYLVIDRLVDTFNAVSANRFDFKMGRAVKSSNFINADVGVRNGKQMFSFNHMISHLQQKISGDENNVSTNGTVSKPLGRLRVLKIFADKSYPMTGGHSRFVRYKFTDFDTCVVVINNLAACESKLEQIKPTLFIAIILVVVISLFFVCMVCFLIMFTLFCVRERRRRRRRRRRRHSRAKKTRQTANVNKKETGAVDIELNSPSNTSALPGMDEEESEKRSGFTGVLSVLGDGKYKDDLKESEKEKREDKGFMGYFAQQMRRLTKVEDDDDEFEEPDRAAHEGDKNGAAAADENDANFAMAKERFEGNIGNDLLSGQLGSVFRTQGDKPVNNSQYMR